MLDASSPGSFGLDDIDRITDWLGRELGALGLTGRLEVRPVDGDASALAALDGWTGVVLFQPEPPADADNGDFWVGAR